MANINIIVTLSPADAETKTADKARAIAEQLALPFCTASPSNDLPYDYLLVVTNQYLALQKRGQKSLFRIDFVTGHLRYRSLQACRRTELLARAIGVSANSSPTIVDATAGFGRDGFILASLGFHTTLLEREKLIYLLLEDAIRHAQLASPKLHTILSRLNLIFVDAMTWLSQQRMDIVYLDPMFPKRNKTASVKKESAILQALASPNNENDDDALFTAALACATKRVVIKRPRLAGHLTQQKPSFSLHGSSCRFDVYIIA